MDRDDFIITVYCLVTPQDTVESAGFSALDRAKTLFIQTWGDLAHRDGVYSTHSTPFCGVTVLPGVRTVSGH